MVNKRETPHFCSMQNGVDEHSGLRRCVMGKWCDKSAPVENGTGDVGKPSLYPHACIFPQAHELGLADYLL